MKLRTVAVLSLAAASLSLAGCGIVLAPFTFAEAVQSNANYSFQGALVDTTGQPVDGVVYTERSERRLWAPLEGTTTKYTDIVKRADRTFSIDVRGTDLHVTFSKEGYRSVSYDFYAGSSKQVSTRGGTWPSTKDFAVMMIPINARDAYLASHKVDIDYARYPIADVVSLPNLLTDGKAGEVIFKDKDASDLTVIPDGVFYVTLDMAPPKPINATGQIDPADLNIPSSATIRIAGVNTGFIRMSPQTGLHPMLVSSLAPEGGYMPELTFDRTRLKEMRTASSDSIPLTSEYFFFRMGDRYGKGVFRWDSGYGKPRFHIELYIQKRQDTRDLTTFNYLK